MSRTISRLYNSHAEARAAVRELEAAGVPHGDISILVSNADSAYDEKTKSFPDRDLDGKDDRAEGAATWWRRGCCYWRHRRSSCRAWPNGDTRRWAGCCRRLACGCF